MNVGELRDSLGSYKVQTHQILNSTGGKEKGKYKPIKNNFPADFFAFFFASISREIYLETQKANPR